VALIAVRSLTNERGGAERLFDGLHAALLDRGVDAHRIDVESDERSFDAILRSYLRCYDLDLSAFDGVISTKAPTYAVRHRSHVCYLVHTMRVFYDRFAQTFEQPSDAIHAQRHVVQQIDTAALSRPSVKSIFAVGETVSRRLREYNGLASEVLHHPSTLKARPSGDFRHILIAGRLHPWKRVDLAIEAARRMRHPVEIVVTGAGDDAHRLHAMAAANPRFRFVGHVSDDALAALYADALGVIFCPVEEDFGLIAVEALAAGKPVVTCADSGEPARLVRDGVNGFICAPEASAMAERLDWLVDHPEAARRMGASGPDVVASIVWDNVCDRLLSALGRPSAGN
jgi:glycosyltransferase involved in cell wall biosynthesis